MKEYETNVKDINEVAKGLKLLGFKEIGCVEVIREDCKLYGCLVSITKMPKIPWYVEIEGSEKNILKISKMFGYSEVDYYPEMIYGKYGIKTKFLRFGKR